MSQRGSKSAKKPTNQKAGQGKKVNARSREAIAYASAAIGTITFGYVAFFEHDVSVWVAYLGVLVILIGIGLYAYGKFQIKFLFSSLAAVALLGFIITMVLFHGKPRSSDPLPLVKLTGIQSETHVIGGQTRLVVGDRLNIAYEMQNVDKGNAFEVQHYVECVITDSLIWPFSFDFSRSTRTVLGSGERISGRVQSEILSRMNCIEMDRNSKRMYVYGQIIYYDGNHDPHWSNFCVWYDPHSGRFVDCTNHNDTDFLPDKEMKPMSRQEKELLPPTPQIPIWSRDDSSKTKKTN